MGYEDNSPILAEPKNWDGLVAPSSTSGSSPTRSTSGLTSTRCTGFEPAARHPLIAVSGGRGDGVSGAGAGTRLDDRHVGRRPLLDGERLELSKFPGCEVDRNFRQPQSLHGILA